MSVPNQTPYNVYTANGLTTVFTFEFYIISADDLQVSINGGVVTSGYTVGGVGNKDGGDITFLTPPANGVVVMLERVVPTFRLTDYQDNGDLLADTVNKDFDRIWMAIQRAFIDLGFALTRPLFGGPFNARGYRIENLAEPVNDQDAATKKFVIENGKLNLARTLRVPESNVGILPTIAARKDSLFGWNSSGQPVPIFSMTQTADLAIKLASTEMGLGGNLVGIYDGRPPVVVTNTVTDKIKDGVAGLRKNFGAVGDGYHDDTAAFNDWWECLMDIAYKRRAYEGDEAAIKFMLQKGPLLTIENGAFIYDGPGLNIGNSDVFVFNVKGESALSTKILLPNDGVYLFDFDNNPVHSLLTDMTIHGGLGAVRFKSKSRSASSTHDFERLRLSRYKECGISNNSIDMPYFRVNKCIFYGATDKQTIGVCVSGYSAGGFIKDSIFSDNRYGIKLAVGDNGTERNGPATPYLIDDNDFYRTGNRGAINEDTGEFERFASYDIWAEPGATAQNSGKGIKFTRNKFGQENLISPDAHILIADAYATGTGAGLNGDRHHNEVISTGFFSGARFDGNDVNSTNGSYVAPFLRTFTPNTGNLSFTDSYDNGMPSRIIEFAGGITQSQIGSLARSNVFDISHCVALQKGVEPKLISNLNDVFRLIDPLLYYVGHPQSTIVPVGSQQVGFELLYSGPTSGIGLSNATRTSLNNSYGGIFEAAEITMTTSQGRATATVSGGVAGRKHWIDFDVRRSALNPVGSVVMEVMDSTGVTVIFRRIILLDTAARWQKVILPYIPNESGDIVVRFRSNLYVAGAATNFVIGNLNVYRNETPVNTGHNSGLRMQWDLQHIVKGARHEWYDNTGNLRAKNGAPTSVTDGVIISANPVV